MDQKTLGRLRDKILKADDKLDKANAGITGARLVLNDSEVTAIKGKSLRKKLLKATNSLTSSSRAVTSAKITLNELMKELPLSKEDADDEQETESEADSAEDNKDGSDISDDEEQPKARQNAPKRKMEDATPQLGEIERKQPKTERKTSDPSSQADGDVNAVAQLLAAQPTPNAAPPMTPNAAPPTIQNAGYCSTTVTR
ncbi:hypothetical protein AAVH_14596 [Aphelenchoides avenae]|nr:hypothetical protein AAVH_14596 [Aphelenchus avenae]